jgi:hypothetical protein
VTDLRDPSTTPLNFTKSINLALSERGINAMRNAGRPELLEHVMAATIPMRGRMIHGKRPNGELLEEPQDYDVHGRVSRPNRTDTATTPCHPMILITSPAQDYIRRGPWWSEQTPAGHPGKNAQR